jgi:hypothetical protein
MKRCFHYLPVVLALLTISFFFSDNITAQKKSKKTYYYSSEKSSSLKSSATKVEFNKNIRKKNNSDRYEKSDSYTRKEKKYLNYNNKSSENYFRIDNSEKSLWDGKHWEESNFPLNIYVKESSSRYYKSVYKDYVKYAMDVWRKADDRIQYKFTNSLNDADIALIFVENLGDEYEEDYLGLTEYETNIEKQIEFSKIQISLIKNGNEKISAGELKATIVHEFGHALGLGHSENKKDLMYPYISPEHSAEMNYEELSKGDKMAIKDVISLGIEDNYVWK